MSQAAGYACRKSLQLGTKSYTYFSLNAAMEAGLGDISRLPFSLKVLLENQLRCFDQDTVQQHHIDAFASWQRDAKCPQEIAYRVGRVLMQDLTGVPAVVDLAAMRDAMSAMGGDPEAINPLCPVDLVIDHSVHVDYTGSSNAFAKNVDLEMKRNAERYRFFALGAKCPV